MQFASVNDSVTLSCGLNKHSPNNATIQWFDGPLPINTAVNSATVKHNKASTKFQSLLTISKVEKFHFGRYTCKFTDNKGESLIADTLLLPTGKHVGKAKVTEQMTKDMTLHS